MDMPFTAILATTKETLTALEISITQLRQYPKGDLLCPECKTVMFPRGRKGYLPHFVHTKKTENCSLAGESQYHLALKLGIYEKCLESYKDAKISVEYSIVKDNKIIRRADVMVLFPTGYGIAFEIQLSPISLEEIKNRTIDYYEQGYDVQWIVKKTTNSDIKDWLLDHGSLNVLTTSDFKSAVISSETLESTLPY